MNNYPKFAQIKNVKYKINTDYRVTLECEKVAQSNVPEEEKALAIIYLLFGDRGLRDSENWQELLEVGLKYLRCGKEIIDNDEETEVDMDFEQDWEYIKASFFYDYKIKLTQKKYMHWWEFYNLLCGLSENCILSRVRFVRNYDISQIKDSKEYEKMARQKEMLMIKKESKKTAEERRLDELFEEQLKGR